MQNNGICCNSLSRPAVDYGIIGKIRTFKAGRYMDKACGILDRKGVKATPNRILVLRSMLLSERPLSLSELETMLDSVDRSSIFRVLTLFVAHHIVHEIEDGSGMAKYEVCSGENECTIEDMHVHFYCENCHRTYCFKDMHIPDVQLPEGFSMDSVNFMVKGTCPSCRGDKDN